MINIVFVIVVFVNVDLCFVAHSLITRPTNKPSVPLEKHAHHVERRTTVWPATVNRAANCPTEDRELWISLYPAQCHACSEWP